MYIFKKKIVKMGEKIINFYFDSTTNKTEIGKKIRLVFELVSLLVFELKWDWTFLDFMNTKLVLLTTIKY